MKALMGYTYENLMFYQNPVMKQHYNAFSKYENPAWGAKKYKKGKKERKVFCIYTHSKQLSSKGYFLELFI